MIAGHFYHFDSEGGAGNDMAQLYSDAAGTLLVGTNDNGGSYEQFSLDYIAAATQTYYLKSGISPGQVTGGGRLITTRSPRTPGTPAIMPGREGPC